MKIKYKILIGLVYTIVIGFIVSTVQHRLTQEEMKSIYEEEYCEVIYEYTGEVDSEEWEELTLLAMELMQERDELQEEIDNGLDELLKEDGSSDADAYISLFYNLADPINWLFTFIIATFIATFYLAFYSAKLWIQRYFKGEIDEG